MGKSNKRSSVMDERVRAISWYVDMQYGQCSSAFKKETAEHLNSTLSDNAINDMVKEMSHEFE